MPARFVAAPHFRARLLSSHDAARALEDVAAVVQSGVKSASPSRDFTRSILAPLLMHEQDAATVRVGTSSSIWHILEYGSIRNPPYRPFALGVQRAGLRFEAR